MKAIGPIIRYELKNVVRSRWLISYTLFFLLATDALLRFSGSSAKAVVSLLNVVLLLIPLVSIVFGTMYRYNGREFTELMLAQPVHRRQLFLGQYLGLTIPMSAAFAVGIGLPFAFHGIDDSSNATTIGVLIACGIALTFTFTALATLIAVRAEDRVKGLGIAIALWLGFAVLYDGLVLLGLMMFADYPLERPALALMMSNPVDLARVILLLRFDVAALMGYTGAVFEQFFGGAGGAALASLALVGWTALPLLVGMRQFQKKDF